MTQPAAIKIATDWAREVLGRWENFDDAFETKRSAVGLIYYTELGPKGRWAVLYQEMSSDLPLNEGSRVELSFSLGTG